MDISIWCSRLMPKVSLFITDTHSDMVQPFSVESFHFILQIHIDGHSDRVLPFSVESFHFILQIHIDGHSDRVLPFSV